MESRGWKVGVESRRRGGREMEGGGVGGEEWRAEGREVGERREG